MTTHRRNLDRPRPSALGAVGSSALSGVLVLALVGVLILAFGDRADRIDRVAEQESAQASDQAADPGLVALPGPDPGAFGPGTEPSAEPSAGPTGSPPAGTVADEDAEAVAGADDAEATAEAEKEAAAREVPVVLFNQTTRTGLATAFQEVLEADGWTVPTVDDWRGTVPATTVYYPPGMQAGAKALMAEFPDIARIRPSFPGIPDEALTVILCKEFPDP